MRAGMTAMMQTYLAQASRLPLLRDRPTRQDPFLDLACEVRAGRVGHRFDLQVAVLQRPSPSAS
jgi:hypothetical protein